MADTRKLQKRFYKAVSISDDNRILLDERVIKTPMKAPLALPNRALAESLADEWDAQGPAIDSATMPMTRLANTAIDRVDKHRADVLAEVVQYAGSDLVCYRAESPERLVKCQAELWDCVISFVNDHLGANFASTTGVMHRSQDAGSLMVFGEYASRFSAFKLVAFHNLTVVTGSALLACMIVENAIDAENAWLAALVDEDFQIEQWGRDNAAELQRAARKAEYDASVRFVKLV
jgi:chaperone required for assembly of F1-ATPase